MTTQPIHTLYRFFDRDGALLYVGRTINARSRFRSHERSKDWFDHVARIDREIFPSAELLAEAEVAAIIAENPLHNIQHSTRDRHTPAPVGVAEDRVLQRVSLMAELWGEETGPCGDDLYDSGCNCVTCVTAIIDQLDYDRQTHDDDEVLLKRIDALEIEYLAGADAVDWLYDLSDLMQFRQMALWSHSEKKPAPAMAFLEDGLITVGCPFCSGLHQHYSAPGAVVAPLVAACGFGRARYLPVFDGLDAIHGSIKWLRSVA